MTTADVSVRPAQPSDAATIAAIQLASWRAVLGEKAVADLTSEAVAADWERAVREEGDSRRRVLVAVAGPHVVGFTAFAPADPALVRTVARLAAEEAGADEATRAVDDVVESVEAVESEAGAAGSEGWTVEIVALEVAPHARRAGHASRLVAAVADLARERHAHHVAAWTAKRDEPRLTFLTGAGLAEVGLRRTLETPGGELEEILLTAVLPG